MRVLGALLLIAVIALVALRLVRRSSLGRRRGTGPSLPALPKVPRGGADHGVEGGYVATTLAGSHRERVDGRGLGHRGTAVTAVRTDGVLIDRRGAPRLFIPRERLSGVRATSSLIVVRWHHGDHDLETGLRIDSARERERLLDQIDSLTQTEGTR